MKQKLLLLAALALTQGLAQGASINSLLSDFRAAYKPNTMLSNTITFGERRISLPEGQWIVAGSAVDSGGISDTEGGMTAGSFARGTLSLFRLSDDGNTVLQRIRLSGSLEISSGRYFYEVSRLCETFKDDYVYDQRVTEHYRYRQDCAISALRLIRPTPAGSKRPDELDLQDHAFLQERKLPDFVFMISRIGVMTRGGNAMDFEYSVNVDASDRKPASLQYWSEMKWQRGSLDAAQSAFITEFGKAADQWKDKLWEVL